VIDGQAPWKQAEPDPTTGANVQLCGRPC